MVTLVQHGIIPWQQGERGRNVERRVREGRKKIFCISYIRIRCNIYPELVKIVVVFQQSTTVHTTPNKGHHRFKLLYKKQDTVREHELHLKNARVTEDEPLHPAKPLREEGSV